MAVAQVGGTGERHEAEEPLLAHLRAMGWQHVRGRDLQDAEARGYRDVLLERRLTAAVRRVNTLPDGTSKIRDEDAPRVVDRLKRAARRAASGSALHAVNKEVTTLLLRGAMEKGANDRDVLVQFLDWSTEAIEGSREEVLARNDFLVVDQFRVRDTDGRDAVLDLVLFVNGIPLVVVECKSPDRRDPLTEAIRDLRAYTGRPLDDDPREPGGRPRGVPELFATVQLLVAADGNDAALGTISSEEEHYALWRSVTPQYGGPEELRRELRDFALVGAHDEPTHQHMLTAIVLHPGNLLNIVRHYVFEMPLKSRKRAKGEAGHGRKTTSGGTRSGRGVPNGATASVRTVKVVCRHQQYRATEKIVRNLRTRRTPLDPGAERDERGGVIWHTQGAGKSFTMQFIARRLHMSRDPELNQITIVAVTDRRDLQWQLREAVELSGCTVREAASRTDLESLLQGAGGPGGRRVIFGTIHKFLGDLPGLPKETDGADTADGADRALQEDFQQAQKRVDQGEDPEEVADPAPDEKTVKAAARVFPKCSDSVRVLVMVDEAHRSHTSVLHACLRTALPNAARVGFTGTPLMQGRLTDTGRIFGFEPSRAPGGNPEFLDEYRMDEAERDKVIVPVRYEGRATTAAVREKERLDTCFEDLVEPLDEEQEQRVRDKYGKISARDVAESVSMIRAKATDMLAHYVTGPLTGGFKAQVAVVSRRAAVLYRHALHDARNQLLADVKAFDDSGRREGLRAKGPDAYTAEEMKLLRAWQYQEVLRRMQFVPVISAGAERKSGLWTEWTDETSQRRHIDRFLEPFPELPPDNPWAITHPHEPDPVPAGRIGAMNPWSDLVFTRQADEGPQPPIAFLIVKSMLLTGFDAPIEQVLYLDRPIRDAELLQAVARVNRPAPQKREGLVVDYFGVLNHLGAALAAYRGSPPAMQSMRSMADEAPEMRRTAAEVQRFLSRVGIDADDLDTRDGLVRARRMLNDPAQRAAFDRCLGAFLNAVDRVLPHEEALRHVADMRRWSTLQMRVRRYYRDGPGGGFTMRGYGRKVRALIADHLQVQEIEQTIAPVSLLAPDFDEIVDRLPAREAAAEQVQALRYHLQERIEREDRPVHHRLSEELEKILKEFEGRWEEIQERVGPLVARARRAEEADPEIADLSPMEQQLYVLLRERLSDDTRFNLPEADVLRQLTTELTEVIVNQVTKAGYEGEDAHVTELESHLMRQLRRSGLHAREDRRGALLGLAGLLAGHATRHLEGFRAEGRRQ